MPVPTLREQLEAITRNGGRAPLPPAPEPLHGRAKDWLSDLTPEQAHEVRTVTEGLARMHRENPDKTDLSSRVNMPDMLASVSPSARQRLFAIAEYYSSETGQKSVPFGRSFSRDELLAADGHLPEIAGPVIDKIAAQGMASILSNRMGTPEQTRKLNVEKQAQGRSLAESIGDAVAIVGSDEATADLLAGKIDVEETLDRYDLSMSGDILDGAGVYGENIDLGEPGSLRDTVIRSMISEDQP